MTQTEFKAAAKVLIADAEAYLLQAHDKATVLLQDVNENRLDFFAMMDAMERTTRAVNSLKVLADTVGNYYRPEK